MGGSCSMQQREEKTTKKEKQGRSETIPQVKSSCRYSVDLQIPDQVIKALYPLEQNAVGPKKLVDLCVDAVCRHLPNMVGELPRGLPQDVVTRIFQSLVSHSAFNATTFKTLSRCQLEALPLSRIRGISDDWFVTPAYSSNEAVLDAKYQDISMREDSNNSTFTLSARQHSGFRRMTSSFDSMTSFDTFPSLNQEQQCKEGKSICIGESMAANIKLLDLSGSFNLSDQGLLALGELAALEVAKLDGCHSLVSRGLRLFTHSCQLRSLSLSNCRCLTDEALYYISHLHSITSLSLNGCRCVTDSALESISKLHSLTRLDLSNCDLISDDGLEYFHHLLELEELSLGWCRLITDTGIETFVSHPQRSQTLRVLRLTRTKITDVSIEHLGKLLFLEELDLSGCSNIGSSALASTLEKLKRLLVIDVSHTSSNILRVSWQGKVDALKYLDLSFCNIKDTSISQFTFIPRLSELRLNSCPIGDNSIAFLADNNVLPNLTKLDLADTAITDASMSKLPLFSKLTHLSLFFCNISNLGLRHLQNMITLEELNLDSRDIDDDGLVFLKKLNNLKSLDLFSGRITDVGCLHISKIGSLEYLELCGGAVGDLGCSYLAALEGLKTLNLAQNERITNRGAACLAVLTNLKSLNLSCTAVTSDCLRYFINLKELQSIALFGCKGIREKSRVGDLENALPSLRCVRLTDSSREDGMVLNQNNGISMVVDLGYFHESSILSSSAIMRERWPYHEEDGDDDDD